MPEKLLTLQELSSYISVSESRIMSLVDEGVISAYRVGGEFLRFRKEQIDAIYSEIISRVSETDRIPTSEARQNVKERQRLIHAARSIPIEDRISDFFYFNDFYLVSLAIIVVLVAVILKG